jgi:hypothetical protein
MAVRLHYELLKEFRDFAQTAPTAKAQMECISQRLHERVLQQQKMKSIKPAPVLSTGAVRSQGLRSPSLSALVLLLLIVLRVGSTLRRTFLGSIIGSSVLLAGLLFVLLSTSPTTLRWVVLSLVRIVTHFENSFACI